MRDIERDKYFMAAAIEEAKKCALLDEVPVGAVVVHDNKIISSSGNGRETFKDATCTVKGFGIVNKAEINVFLELSSFLHVHYHHHYQKAPMK